MVKSSIRWSSCTSAKLLPWSKLFFLLLTVEALGQSLVATCTSKTDVPELLTPCLKLAIPCSPRRCHSLAAASQVPCAQDGQVPISLGFVNWLPSAPFLRNDARCQRIGRNLGCERRLRRILAAPASLVIRFKASFRRNGSVFALGLNEGPTGAEYYCGGLPRACLATNVVMPGAVHTELGSSTASYDERLTPCVEDFSARDSASCILSEFKRSSAAPAVERGNGSTASTPADDRNATAAAAAGQLLEKARLVQATSSGMFCILPLGFRVLKKIEAVCHQELAGMASPLSLPNIMPIHWLQNSDRIRSFGPSLYRLQDRRGRQFFLPPTSEEAAAWLVASNIRSHRDLPQIFYQIGPKFRDEARPRAGCLRAREFVMLEVYSFHQDAMCREATYEKMDECFRRILTRVGTGPVHRVRADSGAMGGPCSHEYHVYSSLGSDRAVAGLDRPEKSRDSSPAVGPEMPQSCTSLEVGHCFQLPETYCQEARARFTDSRGALRMPLMNSYGLGVSRLLAHLALQHQDSKGLLFPPQVAPFCVAVLPQPAARWNDGQWAARLGKALFRILQKTAAKAGGPADVVLDDRHGLTLRQMQSHADLVGIPHQLIIKEDFLRTPGKARVLYISRGAGKADILPIRAALNRLENILFGVAMSSKR